MFDQVAHKIKDLFRNLSEKTERHSDYALVIETDFEHEKHKDHLESHVPGLNQYGTFEDNVEYNQCLMLKNEIEDALRHARESKLQCEILFPCGLISKISQDVVRMSQDEPYGLRGCLLYINLEGKDSCRRIAKIDCDPRTVATFELHLSLKEDNRGWVMIQKLYVTIKGCFKNSRWRSLPKILCSGFQLEKTKLYRSNN
ncbi:DNA damage-inducible transcript 4-like protein [Haliotis cracherodii]|uniref:DNA damage-inducible transcript 4-like protein n=1 Tax=Haliotis rufescens TaxID=6454 RepID=UPI001EAFD730|nr:DNA damage-inducible transcript 4-like protein [Haliotis rufescens]